MGFWLALAVGPNLLVAFTHRHRSVRIRAAVVAGAVGFIILGLAIEPFTDPAEFWLQNCRP